MVMTDPIADMLTRIRNANTVRHEKLELPASKVKKEIAEILKREGFIRDYEYIEDSKQGVIRIFLKYGATNERVITGLKRISKPGLRVYAKAGELPRVLRWTRYCISFNIKRCNDRQGSTSTTSWWRSISLRLVIQSLK